MASSDIRDFQFYKNYLWSETDFENFETWMKARFGAVNEGAFGAAALTGLIVTPGGGLNVDVSAGIAVSPSGRQMVLASAGTGAFASPVGNPARSLIVLRPKDTEMTPIQEPLNPSNTVNLHTKLECELVVINGTPGATPQYPAVGAEDVVLMGVKLTSGHVTIAETDLELAPRDVPRPKSKRIRKVASNYQAVATDEIIEIAATGADVTVTLPVAAQMRGRELSVVLIADSGGIGIVDGSGTEQISGQLTQEIDSQWGSVRVYSDGSAWRVF
jgi:hypothetical protein